jgi:glycine dehydrogenase subunit 1
MRGLNHRLDPGLRGYNVHRPADRQLMLETIGVAHIEELFKDIPSDVRLKRALNLPRPMTEWELRKELQRLADMNRSTRTHLSFLGGGAYEHYIPAVVDAICSRGEFLTAYTPYQPEMSQGLLQVLYEYQQLVSRLVALPTANCSLYDGATAVAEAAWMACSIKKTKRLLVSRSLWPQTLEVLATYMEGRGVELVFVESVSESGELDLDALQVGAAQPAAALLIQTPNRYGVIEDVAAISAICRSRGILTNVATYPIALGILKPPGQLGADIVTCEGQSLGIPLSAGGPYLGVLATLEEYEKFLPGRIVGRLTDLRGQTAFALIKEEREQHVSRDRATSHICSNQALQAMRAAVYLASLGENGLREIAGQNAAKAHYLAHRLTQVPGVRLAKTSAFFNEFTLKLPVRANNVLRQLESAGIFGGIAISDDEILVAVTEVRAREELDRMSELFTKAIGDLS